MLALLSLLPHYHPLYIFQNSMVLLFIVSFLRYLFLDYNIFFYSL